MAEPGPTTAFDALAHPVRQRLVFLLYRDRDHSVGIEELTARLAAASPESSDPSSARLEAALHHVHLPKLEDAGALEYDYADGRVVVRDVDPLYDALAGVVQPNPVAEGCE